MFVSGRRLLALLLPPLSVLAMMEHSWECSMEAAHAADAADAQLSAALAGGPVRLPILPAGDLHARLCELHNQRHAPRMVWVGSNLAPSHVDELGAVLSIEEPVTAALPLPQPQPMPTESAEPAASAELEQPDGIQLQCDEMLGKLDELEVQEAAQAPAAEPQVEEEEALPETVAAAEAAEAAELPPPLQPPEEVVAEQEAEPAVEDMIDRHHEPELRELEPLEMPESEEPAAAALPEEDVEAQQLIALQHMPSQLDQPLMLQPVAPLNVCSIVPVAMTMTPPVLPVLPVLVIAEEDVQALAAETESPQALPQPPEPEPAVEETVTDVPPEDEHAVEEAAAVEAKVALDATPELPLLSPAAEARLVLLLLYAAFCCVLHYTPLVLWYLLCAVAAHCRSSVSRLCCACGCRCRREAALHQQQQQREKVAGSGRSTLLSSRLAHSGGARTHGQL